MSLSPDVFGFGCSVGFTGFVLGCWSCSAAVVLVAPALGMLPQQMGQLGLSPEANGEPGWVRWGARAGGGGGGGGVRTGERARAMLVPGALQGWWVCWSQCTVLCQGLCSGWAGARNHLSPCPGFSLCLMREPLLPLLPHRSSLIRVVLLCQERSLEMLGLQDSHSWVHPCHCSPVTSKILSSSGPEILPRLLLHAVLGIKVSSKAVSGSAPGLFIS